MPSERYASPKLPPRAINEKHGLAVLACDRSGSVSPYINEINQGLHDFGNVMKANHKSASVIDVELLSFADDVTCEVGFRPAAEYVAPTLRASGCTAFNQSIIAALKDIRKRKDYYKSVGISRSSLSSAMGSRRIASMRRKPSRCSRKPTTTRA